MGEEFTTQRSTEVAASGFPVSFDKLIIALAPPLNQSKVFADTLTASQGGQAPAGRFHAALGDSGLAPKITKRAKRLMALPLSGGGTDDDMVEEFDFQKLAGAD